MPYREGDFWRGQVRLKGHPRESRRFGLKKDAAAWERQRKAELKGDAQPKLDLLTLCVEYKLHCKLRHVKRTFQEKSYLIERILTAWGPEIETSDITPRMVKDFLDNEAKIRSSNAANKDRKNLMAMWTYRRKFYNLADTPLTDIEKYPHHVEAQYTPSVADVYSVMMAATREERIFLNAYLQTGGRRSEIMRWTWDDDIEFNRRRVRLGSRKSRDGSMVYRWIDMSDTLYNDLQWLWKNRKFKKSPHVFVNDRPGSQYGKPYKVRRRFMRGLCGRAGVRPFGFHALRRFVASILDGDYELTTIQRILGHSRPSTTDLYLKNLRADQREVMDSITKKIEAEQDKLKTVRQDKLKKS